MAKSRMDKPKDGFGPVGGGTKPVIHKSRYIHEGSVASRGQLHNPTTDHDRNDAAHHRACRLYELRQDGSCLNLDLDLNLDETYSFLDHYDQNLLHHFWLMPKLRLQEQREQPR
jgi:hypothetical protein